MEKICVAVRVRPPKEEEEAINGTFWNIEDNRVSLHRSHGTPISGLSYAFDHVFDQRCTNSMVYELLTKDIIHAAVNGFNGTVFAYGQTSSGKTFTMNGSPTDLGVIHRAVKDIFDLVQMTTDREFLIRVSYMEIYNEEINDLFSVENQKLPIHESLERGIFVSGLREEIVNNAEQVMKLLELGEVNRHFGETNMNVRSSRSHTIFRMVIESKRKETELTGVCSIDDAIRVSVLNLVDLAGSERIAKTGADGVRLKEGKHINKSLMVLGNVINKLSDGAKQRGHIPYRDSKLTRILQPALGGNAKTSIVCTIAPEEIHIEETKGTLQFASRAKRVTNCVQVNEILTDAALLKRQKLEIEELQKKLQGSHATVLEQEILKLKNQMLKYEMERGKLETELEEERKSQKEREQCIREQLMKIENLSNLVNISDSDMRRTEDSVKPVFKEEFNGSNSRVEGDLFSTPCFKAAPKSFVANRSNYSRLPDCSPLPDSFSNVADEDAWLKMNKGYVADLDSIQITPAVKFESSPSMDSTPGCSNDSYKREIQDLRRQLELVTSEKNEFERKHTEQLLLNEQLVGEVSNLKQEAQQMQELPQMFCDSVTSCKRIFGDVMSTAQNLASDGNSSAAKLLSCTSEIGACIFSFLETNSSLTTDGHGFIPQNNNLIEEQGKVLCEKLKSTITLLALPETTQMVKDQDDKNPSLSSNYKGCTLGDEVTCLKENLSDELDMIKEKYNGVKKEFDENNQLLEASRTRYDELERQFEVLKKERDSLRRKASESSEKLVAVTNQNDNVLKELNCELQLRKNREEDFKKFSVAFANRQRSLMSFHNDFKSKVEGLRAHQVTVAKSLDS